MITVAEAITIIDGTTKDFGEETIPLSQGIGRVLKEDWYTDRDLPPYDRVTMDGIAIQFKSYEQGRRDFKIEGVAAAGMELMTMKENESCLEVMTGSILPANVDTVIRYEDLEIIDGVARITIETVFYQQNVHFKGEDRKQGELIVKRNTVLSSSEIGVGASIGKHEIVVAKNPKVMVISTGDELVDIKLTPLPHQIRRSNVYRLVTKLQDFNIEAKSDHLDDEINQIKKVMSVYLEEYDAIILSGGVSKGKFDFLPQVLSELGVEKLFHKIKQKPGKPFWFGQYKEKCTVFALPGNPVSSFVCMQRYFNHWLQICLTGTSPVYPKAMLAEQVHFKSDLNYFLEVELNYDDQARLIATPKKGNGSGDLANLVEADAFIELPRGKDVFEKGAVYSVIKYR